MVPREIARCPVLGQPRANKTAKGASYTVRWTVTGREKSHTLAGRALAERYKSRLLQAAARGEAFDTDSGLPDSMAREVSEVTWLEHATEFMDARWPSTRPRAGCHWPRD